MRASSIPILSAIERSPTNPLATAFSGILENFALAESSAKVMPPAAFTASTPAVPSAPVPDSNADTQLAVFSCKRAQKAIDLRHLIPAWHEDATDQRQRSSGRLTASHGPDSAEESAVDRFAHGHLRGSEQACELAVMLGIKMLNQDEGHARLCRSVLFNNCRTPPILPQTPLCQRPEAWVPFRC